MGIIGYGSNSNFYKVSFFFFELICLLKDVWIYIRKREIDFSLFFKRNFCCGIDRFDKEREGR